MARLVLLLGLLLCFLPAFAADAPATPAETPAKPADAPAKPADTPSKLLGLTLQALEKEDLDTIEAAINKRAGVLVAAVAEDSPAAKAGIIQGEILLKVGDTLVDTPLNADKALAGAKGDIDIVGFYFDADKGAKVAKHTLKLPDNAQPPLDSDTLKKLQALDDAHKAGILNDDEYAKKRAELLAKAALKPDPELEKKLKALDDTRKAGLLTDEEYAKKRAELLKNQPAPPSKYLSAQKGQTYKHALGFSFWYPDGWTVKEMDGGLQLVPDNTAMQDGQATEMYFIAGQPLDGTGITAVTDAKITAVLDAFVKGKISPTMQRKADPTPVTMANGQGQFYEWTAPGVNDTTVVTRIYACVLKNWGVLFCAVGMKDAIDKRDAALKTIFTSFGFEAGKQDPAVVGAWFLVATRALRNEDNVNFSTDDPRRASAVTDEQITVQLNADGAVTRTTISRTIAGGAGVWIDSGDQKTVTQGRWNAGNGTLFIMWQDGSMESYRYGLMQQEGAAPSLKLVTGNTVQFWQKK